MKLTKILAVAAVGVSIVSCNNQQVKTKASLDTYIDSVSYAIGLNTAVRMNMDEAAKSLNPDLYIQGYSEGRDSANTTLIDRKDAEKIISGYFQKVRMEQMKKREEEMKKKAEVDFKDYKKENEQFLVDNKTKEGVKTTASGLQYIVVKEGAGEGPKTTDRVKVHYHGALTDGTVFDSTMEPAKSPAEFGVTQVIKGWTEGLQLMKPGAKYKFFIPQELAYGYQQRGPILKPFSTLVFDVELLEVLPAAQPAQLGAGHSKGDGHGH
ncbi:FKBP-type peptidyl-prolyl cis-trans isomerase [uncultured Tenacibaculum sp.]|uniref:FKBP-type peptidyl-prolyl cis-trans isomerase n=1 Tax=uncultured Tenacibaculum sp. TaxID=174713 RepID=UPI0026303882|nr:FKBP-type peptidyl-prolyl cis-trans isomerase [uncultured Tenacibaculum sp.]